MDTSLESSRDESECDSDYCEDQAHNMRDDNLRRPVLIGMGLLPLDACLVDAHYEKQVTVSRETQ